MQTSFSLAQLADPATAASEKILRACVHCGFCTATCPTYLLLGDELDSPRGRIYLIKNMLESGAPATPEVVRHVDRCLSCLSCMTTCPSGVHYMHLVDHARARIEKTHKRALADRALRAALARILPYPRRFRLALAAGFFARPLRPLVASVPGVGARLASMLNLAPARFPARATPEPAPVVAAPRRGRVAMLEGCAQPALAPQINSAARRLLARLGVETIAPPVGEGCCGALVHHMGREEQALEFARKNIDAWSVEIERGLDAIIITASGCGTTVKDYGYILRDDPAYADKAAKVSALAKDITEFLATFETLPRARETGQLVAYHSACSMQHGQKINDLPKRLLRAAGFVVRDVAEGHICCGSAGVYNILQPQIADRLRGRKIANIAKTRAQVVATGNIGCMAQIGDGAGMPIVHTVELLDWAAGGPSPPALKATGFAPAPA